MKVKILAFGIAKEILGGSPLTLEMRDSCDVNDLRNLLEEKFPGLKQLSSFMIAVNSHYASAGEKISEHDEIAVIPPVSGG